MPNFQDVLAQTLSASEHDGKFDAAEFFQKWFRELGSAYFFVFSKNLRVTNIQFAELRALIRTHISKKEGSGKVGSLQLLSYDELRTSLTLLVNTFPADANEPINRYQYLSRLYE